MILLEVNPSCVIQEQSPNLKCKFHFLVDLAFPVMCCVWGKGKVINDSVFHAEGEWCFVLNIVVINSKSDVCLRFFASLKLWFKCVVACVKLPKNTFILDSENLSRCSLTNFGVLDQIWNHLFSCMIFSHIYNCWYR